MKNTSSIRLGVNIDHVATLRQVRGNTTSYPDLIKIQDLCVKGGADQITIHMREDRRHIQEFDVKNMSIHCAVDVNLEMGATEFMTKVALRYLPQWVCLVPEKRAELTTEGGLDLFHSEVRLQKVISTLQPKGIEVSLFIEPSLRQVEKAFELGADACEFHTGKWVLLKDKKAKQKEWRRLVEAARLCHELGMRVHAGHGLDIEHVKKIKPLPFLVELNIGHSIVCDSIEKGIQNSVKEIKLLLK